MSETLPVAAVPTFGWTYDKPCETMEWTSLHGVSFECEYSYSDGADLTIVGLSEENAAKLSADEGKDALKLPSSELLRVLVQEQGEDFTAKAGSCTETGRVLAGGNLTKVMLVGLGKGDDIGKPAGTGMKVGSAVAAACKKEKQVKTCMVDLSSTSSFDLSEFVTTFLSSMYSDNRYRSGDKEVYHAKDLNCVRIVISNQIDLSTAATAIDQGKALAQGIHLSKDIVNAPHNVLNSVSLANTAIKLSEETNGIIQTKILDKDECEKRNMGSFLGVARGSETEPKFIHMIFKPKGEVKRKLGIVGKGLLFDTGGYNIKVGMMELMKFDCGGAAAVFGAARSIAALQPEGVEVHFFVAACENMVNEKAYVPSDILIASNGKSIEVLNTDAEGRLTLADALVYADVEVGCDKIIELSTLTGTCILALGKQIAGVFTKNDDLAKELEAASTATGDKSWRMPMPEEYNELLESKIADIKNIGTRWGGSITAALFLQNFVSKNKPFAHIDIAGPVWDDSTGATGYGSKLITEWVSEQGK